MELYIVRHGETNWNKLGKLQGSVDTQLNENGIALAEKTAEGMHKEGIVFDKIFSSPYARAFQTARILSKGSRCPIEISEDIREMGFGKYEGVLSRELKTRPEYKRFFQCFVDPAHYQPEGEAESFQQVFERVERFLLEKILPLEGQCEKVLVACHGGVLRAFICIINKLPLEDFWTIAQPNCSVNLARVEGGRIEMVEINRLYYDKEQEAAGGMW